MALQAIYYELRHGHDQMARQHTALDDLATTMQQLRGALLEHADALSLYRGRN